MPWTVKRRDLNGEHLRKIARIEYDDGIAVGYRCERFPRLSHLARTYTDGRPLEQFWFVDGEAVADLDEAVEKLNVPVVLTELERQVLAAIPEGWMAPRALRIYAVAGAPDEEHVARVNALRSIADKGLLEIEKDRVRRRPGPRSP